MHSDSLIARPMIRHLTACTAALVFLHPGVRLAAQVAVESPAYNEYQVRPGGVYVGSIRLFNARAEPQDVRVYQTDYMYFADGTNRFGEPGTEARSNAKWITYGPNTVTVPPGTRLSIDYAITVPDTSATQLAGTYWSLLMVEAVPPAVAAPEVPDSGQVTLGLRQIVRQAIQLVTHVAGTGATQIEFANPQVLATEAGERTLQVELSNAGNVGARLEVYVDVYGEDGTSHGRFAGAQWVIHPGASVRERIDISALPPGVYQALVVADTGDEVFGAQYRLQF